MLDYPLYPTESESNYKYMLLKLNERWFKRVLLFITNGLKGIRNVCLEVYHKAKHQSCWTHICGNVMKYIHTKDKNDVMNDLKKVYKAPDIEEAKNMLHDFMYKYIKKYQRAVAVVEDLTSLFEFYAFPKTIRKNIYTTNLIENLNKNLKRGTKRKEQFPNEESLERFICSFYCDYNQEKWQRVHIGFNRCRSELEDMFQ